MPRSTFRIWAGLILVLLATQAVSAAEVRTIASTGEASSKCIGDPRTPLCALDTWRACFVWGESSLCELVGLVGKEFTSGGDETERGNRIYTYEPSDVLKIEAHHLADIENRLVRLSPDQTWFRPGYVDIRYLSCDYEDRDRCAALVIIVKPMGEVWHLSGWHHADGLDCEYYDLPDGYSAKFSECNLMIPWDDFIDYEISRRAAERRQAQGD